MARKYRFVVSDCTELFLLCLCYSILYAQFYCLNCKGIQNLQAVAIGCSSLILRTHGLCFLCLCVYVCMFCFSLENNMKKTVYPLTRPVYYAAEGMLL